MVASLSLGKIQMIEMRWLEYECEETIVPPTREIQFGKPFDRAVVIKTKLQYRQMINTTVYAGMPDQDFKNRTATMGWSDWKDVPTVRE